MECGVGFKFTALVNCEVIGVDGSQYDGDADYRVKFTAIGADSGLYLHWLAPSEIKELIESANPEKRKIAQQEKIDKLKQQLEEEQAKLEKM